MYPSPATRKLMLHPDTSRGGLEGLLYREWNTQTDFGDVSSVIQCHIPKGSPPGLLTRQCVITLQWFCHLSSLGVSLQALEKVMSSPSVMFHICFTVTVALILSINQKVPEGLWASTLPTMSINITYNDWHGISVSQETKKWNYSEVTPKYSTLRRVGASWNLCQVFS